MELAIIAIIASLITLIAKSHIKPKFGVIGIHIFVIILAIVGGLIKFGFEFIDPVYIQYLVQVWAYAVLFYEIIIKNCQGLLEK